MIPLDKKDHLISIQCAFVSSLEIIQSRIEQLEKMHLQSNFRDIALLKKRALEYEKAIEKLDIAIENCP